MKRPRNHSKLAAPWLAYTDLLSSTLMILTVAIVVSSLAKLVNEKPPIIKLNDEADYRFARGSYAISTGFRDKLISTQLPYIKKVIRCYGIDTIELIGHTDASPNPGASNLDAYKGDKNLLLSASSVSSGSNADLGLLRALSVEKLLKESLKDVNSQIVYKSYSASSFVDPQPTQGSGITRDQAEKHSQSKRRIEVRFTRSEAATGIPKC